MKFSKVLAAVTVGVVTASMLALSSPSLAEEPAHGAPAHGTAVEGAHAEGGHEAKEGEGAHHVTYTDDADGDGIQNWRDSDSEGYVLRNAVVHLGNLVLFLIVVGLLARGSVRDALGNREIGIRKAIADASEAHAAAQAKSDQVSRRLDALDAEIARMKSEAHTSIVEEEQKLVQRAQEEAARIAETAERNIREELLRARTALRKEAVDQAVALAEETLKKQVHPSDQRRLAKSFLESLGEARG